MSPMADRLKRRLRMQVRATPDKGPGSFEAKVSTYDLEYDIGWGWTEKILAGAFDASIDAHPSIPIFYNHYWNLGPIGTGAPSEASGDLTVAGQLYVDSGSDIVGRVYQAMIEEALEEWSIGFWPETIINDKDSPRCDQIAQGDLAEASVCVRGANPDTGTLDLASRGKAWLDGDEREREREVMRIRSMFPGAHDLGAPRSRAAIAVHHTGTSTGAWDGPAQEANLSNDDGASVYRKAFAWVDPDKDADTKVAYKFIHHFVSSDGTVGDASTVACSSAIAVLNGGRGGTTIPEGDIQGVYNHLAAHLKDAGLEPPELKARASGDGAFVPEPYKQDDDELVICPTCGLRNDSDAKFCDQCGDSLLVHGFIPAQYHQDADELVSCPTCGLRDDVDARYCDQCGTQLEGAAGVMVDDDDDETSRSREQHGGDDGADGAPALVRRAMDTSWGRELMARSHKGGSV